MRGLDLTPVRDPDLRRERERDFERLTGFKVEWVPSGVPCPKCNGDGGRIIYGERRVGARTIVDKVPCGHCWRPSGLEKREPSSGAVPCSICKRLPATLRFFDVDGDPVPLCNGPGQRCFERLKEVVVLLPADAPDPAELVDSGTVH